jgi:hypothetical protein
MNKILLTGLVILINAVLLSDRKSRLETLPISKSKPVSLHQLYGIWRSGDLTVDDFLLRQRNLVSMAL